MPSEATERFSGEPDESDELAVDPMSGYRQSILQSFGRSRNTPPPPLIAQIVETGVLLRWHVEVCDAANRPPTSIRVNAMDQTEALRLAGQRIDADRVLGQATPYRKALET